MKVTTLAAGGWRPPTVSSAFVYLAAALMTFCRSLCLLPRRVSVIQWVLEVCVRVCVCIDVQAAISARVSVRFLLFRLHKCASIRYIGAPGCALPHSAKADEGSSRPRALSVDAFASRHAKKRQKGRRLWREFHSLLVLLFVFAATAPFLLGLGLLDDDGGGALAQLDTN